MIRQCRDSDFEAIYQVINEAAQAYKGIIAEDRWKEPYMPEAELQKEVGSGVNFWGYEEAGQIVGVMGIQPVQDVTLIRHAYVRTANQNQGVGGQLLDTLREQTTGHLLEGSPLLVGTWASAVWAISFYEKRGFLLVSHEEKERLLKKYWSIPERQIETSVVLANDRWFKHSLPAST